MRRGLRILARIIVRAHLQRQAFRSGPETGRRRRERTGLSGSGDRRRGFSPRSRHAHKPTGIWSTFMAEPFLSAWREHPDQRTHPAGFYPSHAASLNLALW